MGAHVWRKRPSGAWVVTDGDTGWRDITSEITYTETEWDPWTLSVRRKADDGVTVRLTTTWLGGLGAPSAPANTTLWSPTAGWRIDHTGTTSGVRKGFAIGSMIYDSQSGQQKGKHLTHTWDTGDGRFRDIRVTGGAITARDVGYITYPTNDAWPTVLPGN